jgi:anti-sigma B factor antagonist
MLPTNALDVTVLDHGTTRLVALRGEVDIATVSHAEVVLLDALLTGSETVVLDLAGVTFLDTCGLHLAMNATKIAAVQDVRFVIVPGPPHVQRVFQLAGVLSDVPFARSAGRFAC